MKNYYEDRWEQLSQHTKGENFKARAKFLGDNIKPGQQVLDLGCGTGEFTAMIAKQGAEVFGIDIAHAAVSKASVNYPELKFEQSAIGAPFPADDASFDVVWTSEVIEHIPDTARWLSEVRRVLRPEG